MENKGFVSSCHCISVVVVVVEIGLKHLVSKKKYNSGTIIEFSFVSKKF